MSDTDKENLDWLTSVTPSSGTHAATSSNTVVTQSELAEAIADFGGYEVANGTGADMHPDVQNPSTKIIYLMIPQPGTTGSTNGFTMARRLRHGSSRARPLWTCPVMPRFRPVRPRTMLSCLALMRPWWIPGKSFPTWKT